MSNDAQVLPAPRAPHHCWTEIPERRIAATEFPDGNARTERTCVHCGIVKITVHGSDGVSAWREWRHPESPLNFPAEHSPPCPGPGSRPAGKEAA